MGHKEGVRQKYMCYTKCNFGVSDGGWGGGSECFYAIADLAQGINECGNLKFIGE